MSARIGEIIEVIEEVRANCHGEKPHRAISELRIDAVHSVAARRGITPNSVADKFIRQLSPEVSSTAQFDELLKSWLIDRTETLRDIVLEHAIDSIDKRLIESAFFIATPQDSLLAEEFGMDASSSAFTEGREKLRLHISKERNRNLVNLAKEIWARDGELKCTICSFSFSETYGDAGDGYIEAHHVTPLSELANNTIVRPSDLVPVCSNCHGIIHRHRPWLTIAQIKEIVMHYSRRGA